MQALAIERMIGMDMAMNGPQTALLTLLVLVICVITAYFPARKAGRTDVLDALHYE
jgi:ABC-type antimicrobial peptide transport system permease subunit